LPTGHVRNYMAKWDDECILQCEPAARQSMPPVKCPARSAACLDHDAPSVMAADTDVEEHDGVVRMPFRFPRRICAQTMVQAKASAQASGFGISESRRQLVNTRQSINSKQSANNRRMMRAGKERARAANVREAIANKTKHSKKSFGRRGS